MSELNNKAWYRAIKVLYLLSFLTVVAFIITVFSVEGEFKALDIPSSKIVCLYGNEKQFLMKDIFGRDIMPNSLPTYFNTKGTEPSERILRACEITEILTKDTTNDGRFNFVPYGFEEEHKTQFGYLILPLLVAVGIFEGIRHIFYYIVSGSIKPQT